MDSPFRPRLDILPAPQRTLWPELKQVPPDFVLWGGTAVALHLGHRESVDFDFFSNTATDYDTLARAMPFLRGAEQIQRTDSTLNVRVDRDGPVKLSFFMVPGVLTPVNPPLITDDNNLRVASLLDLAAMKVKVVCERAEAKDYIDIDAILSHSDISLAQAFAAARDVYGEPYNPYPSLKALTFFEDGNLRTLSDDLKGRLIEAVRTVDPLRLPSLKRTTDRDRQ